MAPAGDSFSLVICCFRLNRENGNMSQRYTGCTVIIIPKKRTATYMYKIINSEVQADGQLLFVYSSYSRPLILFCTSYLKNNKKGSSAHILLK